jgi:hypothetical protein
MIISNNTKEQVKKTFDSLGFEIQPKEKEYIEDRITYKKVIDNYLSIELIIGNKDCPTLGKGLFDIYQPLSTTYIGSINKNTSLAYKELLEKCSCDYICIIEPNILFDTAWLEHLLHFYEYVNDSGIISISTNPNEYILQAILNSNDEFTHVLMPNDNILKYIYFFKKSLLDICPIPYVIDNNINPLQIYCKDISNLGYKNYYIPTSFAIQHT